MYVEYQDPTNGNAVKTVDLTEKQEAFLKSQAKFPLYSGGFGCLSGDSEVWCDGKYRKIKSIKDGFKTISIVGGKPKTTNALAPVKYDKADLYEVTFDNKNKITVTSEHRFLTTRGYRKLKELSVGDQLYVYDPLETTSESSLSNRLSDALHSTDKLSSFLAGYRSLRRSGARQLRLVEDGDRAYLLQRDGVRVHSLENCIVDDGVHIPRYTRTYLTLFRPSSDDYYDPTVPPSTTVANRISLIASEYTLGLRLRLRLFAAKISLLSLGALSLVSKIFSYKSPHSNPTTSVTKIQFKKNDFYYDLHVPYANNYLAEGVFNHNCGKTFILCFKIMDKLSIPNNYGLLGRLKYNELKDTVMQTFFEVCPPNYIKSFNRSELRVYMQNGSQIVFRHLDTIAEDEVKSMNLGFFAIDQAEEIPEALFLALRGRLRRKLEIKKDEKYIHQGMMTCNPALTWLYKYYKQQVDEDYDLYEGSTMDNKDHLPPEYIADLLKYPEAWKRQYVYGIWDESLLADKAYFPAEYLQEQKVLMTKKIRDFEGFRIYAEAKSDHKYQIGVDPADSGEDFSAIVVTDVDKAQVVAAWKGQKPADSLAHDIAKIGRIYGNAKAIVEINGIGLATMTKLKTMYSNIYKREAFDQKTRKRTNKLGWYTTYGNKILIFDNLLRLMRENKVLINDEMIIDEFKTFVWTDEAAQKGLGAQSGFHDDLAMACALAFIDIKGGKQEIPDEASIPANSVLGTMEAIKRLRSRDDYIGNL